MKNEKLRKRADEKRALVAELKIRIGCIDCGYKADPRALEFDHKENSGKAHSGKQRTVSSLMYSSWETIMREVSKCDVVCCNCHAIRTHNRKQDTPMVK